jgi:hypothetical protein
MAGVYGNMLLAFPELIKEYEVFKMEPHIGGGYGPRYDKRTVTGYMSWRKHREMGIEGGATVRNDRGTFWEQCDLRTGESVIEDGCFVEIKNKIYKFVEGDDFSAEGGFARWTVQFVPGLTDRQHTNAKVDEVIRNDYV